MSHIAIASLLGKGGGGIVNTFVNCSCTVLHSINFIEWYCCMGIVHRAVLYCAALYCYLDSS